MSRKFQLAAAFAVAAMMVFTITGADGVVAQDQILGEGQKQESVVEPITQPETAEEQQSAVRFVSQEVVQPLPVADEPAQPAGNAASLEELVATVSIADELPRDLQCLASAIYFEARGEPLLGQLAVGEVIINRSQSDNFPSSYCGVVTQPSQFSFVRGGRIPSPKTASAAWKRAKAIATIAHEGLWDSPAEDALYFHATHVKPRWRLTRVGRVDSHIFYR